MKLTFLGTSAGESYPALWCHCPNCEYAREHRGKNIRQNSCAFLDEDVMIDLSHHAFRSALQYGVDITRMRYLFVTHDHADHFYSQHLTWRGLPITDGKPQELTSQFDEVQALHRMGACQTERPFLDIYAHQSVFDVLLANPRFRADDIEHVYNMAMHPLYRGEKVILSNMTVTALVSHHSKPGTVFNYIFQREGKTLLYALDCGGYDEDMLSIIGKHHFDCVVLEGTFGHMQEEFSMHQNKEKNLRMLDYFNNNHLWVKDSKLVLSHMAPHWTPPYDIYSREMAEYGITVAYDGMTINI